MEDSNKSGFSKVFNSLYELLVKLITEAPFTLIFLVLIIVIYYLMKQKIMKKYFPLKPKDKLSFFAEKYYYDSNWSVIRLFVWIIEFCAVLFLSIFFLDLIGFKIPDGIY